MAGRHHWLNGHGFGWTPGVGDGQGGLACCSPWGRKESDTTEQLNWTELNWCLAFLDFWQSVQTNIWCHLLRLPEMTSLPTVFVCTFVLLLCFGLSKIYYIGLLEIHRRYSQKVSQLSLVSLILEQNKREVLQHSSHFSYDKPCQTIWWNTLLLWLMTLKHNLVASN